MSSGSNNNSVVNTPVSAQEGNICDSELQHSPINDNENQCIEYDCFQEMKILRLKHSKTIIVGYININSIRNKFSDFSIMIKDLLDIIIIAETKLDDTFPKGQFLIEGFKQPYRLDVTANSGGLLVYLKDGIISKELNKENISKQIQAIPIELNIRKQKWLLLPIYKPPNQDPTLFNSEISKLIDIYLKLCENIVILGDFNMEPKDPKMTPLIEDCNLYNLIHNPTCYKTENGRCIDLILTNKKHSFLKSRSFETGYSDHHHLIYTMLKCTYTKVPPKKIRYRKYKNFSEEQFQIELDANLRKR